MKTACCVLSAAVLAASPLVFAQHGSSASNMALAGHDDLQGHPRNSHDEGQGDQCPQRPVGRGTEQTGHHDLEDDGEAVRPQRGAGGLAASRCSGLVRAGLGSQAVGETVRGSTHRTEAGRRRAGRSRSGRLRVQRRVCAGGRRVLARARGCRTGGGRRRCGS